LLIPFILLSLIFVSYFSSLHLRLALVSDFAAVTTLAFTLFEGALPLPLPLPLPLSCAERYSYFK
jgi:hypothetical protein